MKPVRKKEKQQLSIVTVLAVMLGLFVGGGVVLWMMFESIALDCRILFHYVESECTIVDKKFIVNRSTDPESSDLFRAEFTFRFKAGDSWITTSGYDGGTGTSNFYTHWQNIFRRYEKGGTYPCWFDPEKPQHAVLVRKLPWYAVLVVIPLCLLMAGPVAAMTLVNYLRDWFGGTDPKLTFSKEFLCNPVGKKGSRLPYRLGKHRPGTGGALTGIACILVWAPETWEHICDLAFACSYGFPTIRDFFWLGLLGVTGRYLVPWTYRHVSQFCSFGATIVEISEPSLTPDLSFELAVMQHGAMRLKRLAAKLVMKEEVMYSVGSGSSMQEQTIFTGELGQLTEERIYPGRPATLRARVRFPAGAMHSINLPSNKIFWELLIIVERDTGKAFEHAFEVPVLPGRPA